MRFVWQFLDMVAVKYLEHRYARVHRTGPVRLRSMWDWHQSSDFDTKKD